MIQQSIISETNCGELKSTSAARRSRRHGATGRLAALAAVAIACLATPLSYAQSTYPTKPLKVVLGFSAGGGTDAMTRAIGRYMGESLGTSVVIDNKPGANGNIAAEIVAKAPTDGGGVLLVT